MIAAVFDEDTQQWVQKVPAKEFYSVRETAIILYTGNVSVRNSINRGTLKGVRVNGVVRVRHEAICEYIQRRGAVPGADPTHLEIVDIIPKHKKSPQAVVASLIPNADPPISTDRLAFLDE